MEAQGEKAAEAERKGDTRYIVHKQSKQLVADAGSQKYGKDEYELMLRVLAWLDYGRREALKQQYAEMLGFGRMSQVEQERKLYDNKAYQKAVGEAQVAADRDKRIMREIFERHAKARILEDRMKLRVERMRRVRDAVRRRLEDKSREYETKKKMYDQKFETIESTAYNSGSGRIEEDKVRYETLAKELEEKIRQESDAIAAAQRALETSEKEREALERSMSESRGALQSAMDVLRQALDRLKPAEKPPTGSFEPMKITTSIPVQAVPTPTPPPSPSPTTSPPPAESPPPPSLPPVR